MRIVTNQELSNFKILPFDLFNESNDKIMSAGEVLTPGKLIMLKNYPNLYTEEYKNDVDTELDFKSKEAIKRMTQFTYESLNTDEFDTVMNKDGAIEMREQVRAKYYYSKINDLFAQGYFQEGYAKLTSLVNIIFTTYFRNYNISLKGSQVRFLGEYELCHPINVGIISGLIAKKLDYQSGDIEKVIIAGFLHDIGKFRINSKGVSSIITASEDEVREHTNLGYNIIKNELYLQEEIAKVALEHHENNDGSGYPKGLSSDYISEWSQIINVANYYDNLAFNRYGMHVLSNRDALRAMLEIGTKRFSAKILYTFIHMFTYDDPKDFSEMSI